MDICALLAECRDNEGERRCVLAANMIELIRGMLYNTVLRGRAPRARVTVRAFITALPGTALRAPPNKAFEPTRLR